MKLATIRDNLNLISKLTLKRFFNALMLTGSYYWSRFAKKPIHRGMPASISFEPTTSCNLRCPECPSGLRSFTRPIGMLEPGFFKKTIDELAPELLYLVFYFQGEPYLNRNFLEMVRYASQKKIYTATSTNAHYFDDETCQKTIESGLDRLIISIDGTTQDVYEQYRVGGKLEKVISGTKNLLHWRKKLKSQTPFVVFQFLVVKPNEHQIDDAIQLADELGVDDIWFKTAQIYDYEHGNELIPTKDEYSRYKKQKDGTYSIKNTLVNHCWKMWHSCVITWDGRVVPCCFDKDAEHAMGELKSASFGEIWNGIPYRSFRGAVLRSRSEIDICKNCTEGTKVWG
ncbi:MAG: SPASM domain-containing protein [Flavobacteriales bacterium]|nr:SPASM domain-containing protein [Flavobacteriales bacterium]